MSHISEDEIDTKLVKVDLLDRDALRDFCWECYQPLKLSDRWKVFTFEDFLNDLPKSEEYLDAGDYTGAATKFAFTLYKDILTNAPTPKNLYDDKDPITSLFRETQLFDNEAPEWIEGALTLAIAKGLSHVAVCEEHDISNPTSLFNELRFVIANSVFKMDEKYLEISGKIGMLIMTSSASRGAGYLEKDPVLTYYTDYILRTWDDLPIPATYQGSKVIEALNAAKAKKTESYGLFIASLFGVTMMAIQLGLVNLESAKVLSTTISNYIATLQENA